MPLPKARKIIKLDYLILLLIIGLAYYIIFIPHQNYPYPLHVDEWVHLAYVKALLNVGNIGQSAPFFNSFLLESGFHLFWGVFQQLSGISWITIFRYFPGIIFIITVLSVYILAQREGFGWEAALLTCLIPTTVGILGPAFMVPVAMGLLFIPLVMFLAFNFRSVWSYLLIFIFFCFLLAIHAPTAVGLFIILTPYILLNLKGNFKHSLGITLALVTPFLVIFPWISALLLPTAKSLLISQPPTEYVQLPQIIKTYGYLPILLGLLGTFLLVIRGGKKNYGLILGLLALLLMLVTFYTLHYGVPIIYERGLTYMMLMMSIIAGAGLMGVKKLRLPARLTSRLKVPLITRNVGNILCLALIGITLAISIPDRLGIPYYHMIDKQDYQAFVWIKENINEDYGIAILDPWKATAFTAITEKKAYTRTHAYPTAQDNEAYTFLRSGSSDTTFLRENGISVIYTRVYDGGQNRNTEYNSDNPSLVEMAKNIYLLKETQKGE